MDGVAYQVEPGRPEIFDPAALLDLRDATDRQPRRIHDTAPLLSRLVGSPVYRRNVVLRGGPPPRALRLWRVYPLAMLACDRIEKGETAESWRGDLCRANGLRWMPFTRGEKVTRDQLAQKIARAA